MTVRARAARALWDEREAVRDRLKRSLLLNPDDLDARESLWARHMDLTKALEAL